MKYTRDKFSQDEIDQIETLGKIVSYVFDINEDDLRGRGRVRELVDARKVLSSYASSNIEVSLYSKFNMGDSRQLSLAAYYLGVDHSTISYQIGEASQLYRFNENFRQYYDAVVKIINDQDIEVLDKINKSSVINKYTWEDMRDNQRFANGVKYSTVPKDVVDGISNLYVRGYGTGMIADKYLTTPSFVIYLAKVLKLVKNNRLSDLNKNRYLLSAFQTKKPNIGTSRSHVDY